MPEGFNSLLRDIVVWLVAWFGQYLVLLFYCGVVVLIIVYMDMMDSSEAFVFTMDLTQLIRMVGVIVVVRISVRVIVLAFVL
jgi:hypothetical protein